jgi:hypothetical protein
MTSLSRDAMPSTEGSAQPSTTLNVSSSHPRVSSFRPLPFPAFTRDRVPAGLLSGAATVGYREVWTLSDSALEPSSRRPAPTMNQQFLGRFEDLGLASPRALVSVRERTRSSSFHYSWSVGVLRSFGLCGRWLPVGRPFDDRADDHTVGSIVKGHVPEREGPTTDVETPPLASQPFRRKDSLRGGVSGRYEPRVRCRLRASATVIRASHLCGDLPGRVRRGGGASCPYNGARGLRV